MILKSMFQVHCTKSSQIVQACNSQDGFVLFCTFALEGSEVMCSKIILGGTGIYF